MNNANLRVKLTCLEAPSTYLGKPNSGRPLEVGVDYRVHIVFDDGELTNSCMRVLDEDIPVGLTGSAEVLVINAVRVKNNLFKGSKFKLSVPTYDVALGEIIECYSCQ